MTGFEIASSENLTQVLEGSLIQNITHPARLACYPWLVLFTRCQLLGSGLTIAKVYLFKSIYLLATPLTSSAVTA